MMIDKIYILNAKDQTERLGQCYRMLKNQQFPDEKIAVWTAKTCQPYKKTRELCEAAASEGYKFFDNLLETQAHNQCNITNLAQTWSHCAFMQHITECCETAILLYDDQRINCTPTDLENALDLLPDKKLLDLAALSCIIHESNNILEGTCWIQAGWACLDGALLYTPMGAKQMLTYLNNYRGGGEYAQQYYLGEYFWIIKDNLKYLNHFYGLLINPIPENLKNLKSLLDNLNTYTGYDLAAVENEDAPFSSTIYNPDPKGDRFLRPIKHTRDN